MTFETVLHFLRDPRKGNVLWWRNEETKDFIVVCSDCEAARRIPMDELKDDEPFEFSHRVWCPTQTPAGTRQKKLVH
jgi:hypothetical protein